MIQNIARSHIRWYLQLVPSHESAIEIGHKEPVASDNWSLWQGHHHSAHLLRKEKIGSVGYLKVELFQQAILLHIDSQLLLVFSCYPPRAWQFLDTQHRASPKYNGWREPIHLLRLETQRSSWVTIQSLPHHSQAASITWLLQSRVEQGKILRRDLSKIPLPPADFEILRKAPKGWPSKATLPWVLTIFPPWSRSQSRFVDTRWSVTRRAQRHRYQWDTWC